MDDGRKWKLLVTALRALLILVRYTISYPSLIPTRELADAKQDIDNLEWEIDHPTESD